MTLPAGVEIGPGRRLPVSQRGYFTMGSDGKRHYTACRFAGAAQILERTGYRLPLDRTKPAPGQPDNFVHQLQQAGDPTPHNGSTARQLQRALRKLLPDAPVLFGTMSEAELFTALEEGATVSLVVDCSKLPRNLKRYVGQGFNGGHVVTLDARSGPLVAMTDPMHRPAAAIAPRMVLWSELSPAVGRTAKGIVVTLGYDSAAKLPETDAEKIARLERELQAEVDAHTTTKAALASVEARLAVLSSASGYLAGDIEAAVTRYQERIK